MSANPERRSLAQRRARFIRMLRQLPSYERAVARKMIHDLAAEQRRAKFRAEFMVLKGGAS
jgi:hypothetical protein